MWFEANYIPIKEEGLGNMHAICQTEWQLTEWPIQAAATPLRTTHIPTILLSNDGQTDDSSVGPIDIRKTCTSLPPCLRTGILLIESFTGDERRKNDTSRCGASGILERSNTVTEGEKEREGEAEKTQ